MLQMLDEVGAETDVRPALALLAAPEPLVEQDELTPALRRAMLLLAAGGDPHRELELTRAPSPRSRPSSTVQSAGRR